jgi:uncharacterized membrane protein YccC
VDNLTLKSNIFRHSLRVGIATIMGYLISRFLPLGHGYWILLTVIVILKPAYSLTKRRNFERLAGTFAGALAGFLIIWLIADRTALFTLMVLFMIGTYAFLRTNYLVCVTLMTPYVLLLFHLLYPSSFRTIISDRVIDTVIGSAIAFLANIFIVPSWEHEQILTYMARIIEDNLRYFTDVSAAFTGRPATVTQYKLSRKHAFVSLANLSDAFNRMLSEPRSKQKNAVRMHQFVVSSHMLTSHIATLAYYVPSLAAKYASEEFLPVVQAIAGKLENGVKALRQVPEGQAGPGISGHEVLAEPGRPGGSTILDKERSDDGKEGLRTLNEKVEQLVQKRRTELEQGITDSDTRILLSGFKPIADQFNFIAKVSADIEKLSREINYSNPASPAFSSPVPSS